MTQATMEAMFVESGRARLMASPLAGLAADERVVDLFCGAGGWGEGAKELGIRVDFAVNHSTQAIETHRLNNPGCIHHEGDAWQAEPRLVVGGEKVGLLMASAACTTHSRARGAAPISPRVHMLGWCIYRWAVEVEPRVILIENVPEWQEWGPLVLKRDEHGKAVRDGQRRVVRVQDPAKKGREFRKWWKAMVKLGYVMEKRVLDAPDFGAASRRKRLFIIARRDGQPIVWPEKTHGKVDSESRRSGAVQDHGSDGRCDKQDGASVRVQSRVGAAAGTEGRKDPGWSVHRRGSCRGVEGGIDSAEPASAGRESRVRGWASEANVGAPLNPYATAAQCIDWSDLGTSIFERKRPLRPKTLARIAEGIRRYVLNDPKPFVLVCAHGEGKDGRWGRGALPIDAPLNTIHAGGNGFGVAMPVLQVIRGDVAGKDVRGVLPTITAGNGPGRGAGAGHALGVATLLGAPILCPAGGAVFKPSRVDEPYHAVLTREDTALVTPIIAPQNGGVYGQRVDAPGPTITTKGHQAVIAPVLANFRHGGGQHGSAGEPMHCVTSGGNHGALVSALLLEYYGNTTRAGRADKPLGCVTTLDRHGLVVCVIDGAEFVIVDILFRMLRPKELAKAMGFRDDFVWPRTQRETVKLIGNAVAPPMARALVSAVLPRGRGAA